MAASARTATTAPVDLHGFRRPPERPRAGLAFSIALHLLVAALVIFGLPFLPPTEPPLDESVPVDLVPLGETTAAPPPKAEQPPPPKEEPKPEPPKAEVQPPKPEPPKPEPPKAAPPPPPPPPPPPEPPKLAVPEPVKKPEPPKEEPKPPQNQIAEAKPQKKPPPPPDDYDSLLKTLDKMKQAPKPPAPQPDSLKDLEKTIAQMEQKTPTPQPQQVTAATPAPLSSLQPSASDIDFVRSQIERRWNFDIGARDAGSLIVQVHVLLQPDGTVSEADIVDNPRYSTDSFYRSAADSARRAVLAASPLQLPPGKYEMFKDFTFRFDPRNAVR